MCMCMCMCMHICMHMCMHNMCSMCSMCAKRSGACAGGGGFVRSEALLQAVNNISGK